MGSADLTDSEIEAADIDGSGKADIADLAYFKQFVCNDSNINRNLLINFKKHTLKAEIKEVDEKEILVDAYEFSDNSKVTSLIRINYDSEKDYTTLDFTGDEKNGLAVIRFLSKNTDVEWSFWGGNTWDEKNHAEVAFATLGTSHIKDSDPGSTHLVLNASIKKDIKHSNPLKFFYHTHPWRERWGTWASNGEGHDKSIRSCCLLGSPNASIGIIHKGILWDYFNNKIKADF